MKNISTILILGILMLSCSSSKNKRVKTRYFNEYNNEISKSKFIEIRSTNRLLDIPGDSANHRKLTLREKSGKITNRHTIDSLLEKETNYELDSNKPLVIIYYPGKDRCNSSGSATKETRKAWFNQLEDGINQIAQTKPIYLYKNSDGLEKYDGILTWNKDPDGIIERLFFEHPYPCNSFVVISKDGEYFSYFGEFSKEKVWVATHSMNK